MSVQVEKKFPNHEKMRKPLIINCHYTGFFPLFLGILPRWRKSDFGRVGALRRADAAAGRPCHRPVQGLTCAHLVIMPRIQFAISVFSL
jgi:hypothetical protein